MMATCIHCGEKFSINKNTIDMIENGYITIDQVTTCDLCFETMESPLDYNEISDADPGL